MTRDSGERSRPNLSFYDFPYGHAVRHGFAFSGVVYGRCRVSIEPGDSGVPHEAAVIRSNPGVEGEGGGSAGGRNLVRREFFERHR